MARQSSVFVRTLTMEEGRRLQKISRTAKDPDQATSRDRGADVRARPDRQGHHLVVQVSDDYVRDVIYAFNEQGFEALHPKWRGGRPKASTDPDFLSKMHTILALYDNPPADGRVVCVDEFGPLNLQPRKGKSWRPATSPLWLRATYHRYDFGDAHARRTRFGQRQNVLPNQAT